MNPEALTGATPTWTGANLTFWLLTALVLYSAGVAALSRRIVYAAFGLFFTLLGMAGYFVLLGSGFLAVTQIIVYVGGILVLLMFGILLTSTPLQRDEPTSLLYRASVVVIGILLLALLGTIIFEAPWQVTPDAATPPAEVRALGESLLTTYVLPLEVAGMTLLLCLIGAAYLVRRHE